MERIKEFAFFKLPPKFTSDKMGYFTEKNILLEALRLSVWHGEQKWRSHCHTLLWSLCHLILTDKLKLTWEGLRIIICTKPNHGDSRTGLSGCMPTTNMVKTIFERWSQLLFYFWLCLYGDSANAVPTVRNCTPEFPTLGGIAGCQPSRGAMAGPLPGRSAFLITEIFWAR